MLGKLLGKCVRTLNAPIRAAENMLTGELQDMPNDERILSNPLDALADELEKSDKDE